MLNGRIPDPHWIMTIDRARRSSLLTALKRNRLQMKGGLTFGLVDRGLVVIGSFLVVVGQKLQARHMPAMSPS